MHVGVSEQLNREPLSAEVGPSTDVGTVRGTRLVVQSLCGLGLMGRGPL
jgi:hypothetical protein